MLAQVIAEKEELPSTRSKSVLTAAVDLADLFIGQIVCSYIRLCLSIGCLLLSIAVSTWPVSLHVSILSVSLLSNCHYIAFCELLLLLLYNDTNIQIDTNIIFHLFIYFCIVTNQQFFSLPVCTFVCIFRTYCTFCITCLCLSAWSFPILAPIIITITPNVQN